MSLANMPLRRLFDVFKMSYVPILDFVLSGKILLTGFPAGFVLRSAQLCTQHIQFSKINFTTST